MKINGIELEEYTSEALLKLKRRNQRLIKLRNRSLVAFVICLFLMLLMLKTESNRPLVISYLLAYVCIFLFLFRSRIISNDHKQFDSEVDRIIDSRLTSEKRKEIEETLEEDYRTTKKIIVKSVVKLIVIVLVIVFIICGFYSCSQSKHSYDNNSDDSNGIPYNKNDDFYANHDYDDDGAINQNEWEDALGDYMDEMMN